MSEGMKTALQADASQQAALAYAGSQLILGQPGTGKTRVLLEYANNLLNAGVPADHIVLTTFAFRGQEVIRNLAQVYTPQVASRLTFQALKDWVLPVLRAGGHTQHEATNNDVRRLLRSLIITENFPGTLAEAEHVIRGAKSRAKKLPESDPNFAFFNAFNALLKQRRLIDRHDIVRQHLISMRNGSLSPLKVRYLLVDNIQDATELQLVWLREHVNAGVTVVLAGHDDLTAFGHDGVQGPAGIASIQTWPNVATHVLTTNYRLPQGLGVAALKVARFLPERSIQTDNTGFVSAEKGQLVIQQHNLVTEERRWLANEALKLVDEGKTVGVITATDYEANALAHMMRKHGRNPALYGRVIWEDPVPQTVLALLSLLLNRATPRHLALVLMGFGVPPTLVNGWLVASTSGGEPGEGLMAEDWLPAGAPLPAIADADPETLAVIDAMRRNLLYAWRALSQRLVDPRNVFLACLGHLLDALPDHEDPYALLAADMLLSLRGDLVELLPRVTRETLPDMRAPVTVAPAREVRNLEFDVVLFAGVNDNDWPTKPSADVPALMIPALARPDASRRLFYLAATRARQQLVLSYTGTLSPFAAELEQAYKNATRRG